MEQKARALVERKKALLFCEQKRSKKNFDFFDTTTAGISQARSGAKVFLVLFFQKKNCFPFLSFMR
jgi:GR25 family glycosyltransferase involved in LPS biosynthesis